MARPCFNRNHTKEDRIVITVGLLVVYGFCLYLGIKGIIKLEKEKKDRAANTNSYKR